MTIKTSKSRYFSPSLVGLALALSTIVAPAANAQSESNSVMLDRINQYGTEDTNGSLGQGIPGASQFSDVSPRDWAFQALDDLSRRYDCLKGYPNGTFRGNRALTRYEFAAGLNACLQQIERLIAGNSGSVDPTDLAALERLVQSFDTELSLLRNRVDGLENRTSFLEDNQFSTTTKLSGEVIFGITSDFSDGLNNSSISSGVGSVGEAIFGDRVRLTLNTSFTGEDLLVTRLAAGNLSTLSNGAGYESTQTFNLAPDNTNDVAVDWLAYYFPFNNSQAYVAATGGIWSDIAPTLNPYFEDFDGGNGALSTFASENPIYRIGGGSGAAFSFGFSPIESILGPSTVTIGYLAGQASTANQGLFDSDYAAFAQLNGNLSDRVGFGVTYVHGYHKSGRDIFASGGGAGSGIVGTTIANNPVGTGAFLSGDTTGGIATNSYGAELAFRPSDSISLSGFATWTDARIIGTGDADIWTFGGGLAFPDLGKEGSVLGIFGGAQPTLRGVEGNVNRAAFDKDFSWHIEAFYKYQLNDSISITPGLIWLTNPNQTQGNDTDAIIGTLRTTFTF